MIVFNLACEHEHLFEGWFGSAEDFADQSARDLVKCPICESSKVERRLSVPRVNLGAVEPTPAVQAKPDPAQMQSLWLHAVRRLVESTEDVGANFSDEALRIHAREAPERGIRGTATPDQTRALAEDGIEVMSISLPEFLKRPLQ